MSIPVQRPACQHAFAVADRFGQARRENAPKCGMIFKAEAKAAEAIKLSQTWACLNLVRRFRPLNDW